MGKPKAPEPPSPQETSAAQTGTNIGDDLREGKPTLPLIYLLQHGTLSQRDLVRKAIESGGVDQDHRDFQTILDAVHSSGALAFTRQQANLEASAARQAISLLPQGDAQRALLALTEYATDRSH